MGKRTRYRQLNRQAQRRAAQRRAERTRRLSILTKVAAGVIALGLGVGAFAYLGAGSSDAPPVVAGGDSLVSPQPEDLGQQVGTVDPAPLAAETACGATPPPTASVPKPQFSSPAQVIDENTRYFATFSTSCGEVVVKLLPETAPETVNSFVFLAEQGYFEGQIFHRLDTSIDVIQGGDPTGSGTGGPGYSISDELSGSDTYGPGTLAMANAGPNTGGSQFFFIAGENGHVLDDNPAYTVFGQVVEGMDVLRRMLGVPIADPSGATGIAGQRPVQAIYLESVTVTNG